MNNKEIELKKITHLTNDEYTFLINYITEKEKQARNKALDEVEKIGVTAIQNNLSKSFKGTFEDALKNGYTMDKHYVIVDWIFFHELLKEEKEMRKK